MINAFIACSRSPAMMHMRASCACLPRHVSNPLFTARASPWRSVGQRVNKCASVSMHVGLPTGSAPRSFPPNEMAARNSRETRCDFNQNLIEPPPSFEQLCNMINKLGKDSGIAECNRADLLAVDMKYDVDLEPAMLKYSAQVRSLTY